MDNNKKEIGKGFKKVVFVYICISLVVGLISMFAFFIIIANKTGQSSNPFNWIRNYVQEDQAYKKQFENNPPPEFLSIGGMGSQSNFVFVKLSELSIGNATCKPAPKSIPVIGFSPKI